MVGCVCLCGKFCDKFDAVDCKVCYVWLVVWYVICGRLCGMIALVDCMVCYYS